MSHARAYVVLLLILVSLSNGFSQEYRYIPFPDSNAIWSEIYYPGTDLNGYMQPPILERFAVPGGDTIIDTLTYKKLYIFYDTIFNINEATCIGGIREDDKKRVYFKGDLGIHNCKPMNFAYEYKEIILFDFSLSVGDTIKNINCRPEDDLIIVKNIDTVVIGNTMRKLFSFEYFGWVNWIEGIGNLRGLLFTSGDIPNNGLFDDLICFKQNDTVFYFNSTYADCMPLITNIKTENLNISLRAYPNPAIGGIIRFCFDEFCFNTIQIFNSNGLSIENIDVSRQLDVIHSVEKYQPGLYIYKLTTQTGNSVFGKFLVR